MNNIFYQFSATSLQGKEISMESYKGKTLLVVNTASKCGLKWNFTKFLVSSEGKPLKRFAPVTKPEAIDTYLSNLFQKL